MLIDAILLAVIIVLLLILSMVWPPDSPWAPWWRTSADISQAACRLANVNKTDTVYELGSGDGQMLITAAKEYGAKGIGIEIDPIRFYSAKFFVWIQRTRSVRFIKGNFFSHDISEATIVYFYLVPNAIKKLMPKLLKELKPGTRIVSLRYEVPLPLVKLDKKCNLRLYKIA